VAEALKRQNDTKLAATPEAEPLRRRAAGHLGLGALRRPSGGLRLSRVGVAYVLLALAIAGAAAGLILVFVNSGKSSPTSAVGTAESSSWSTWQPTTRNRVATIEQIAKHVQARYRLAGGQQLAGVIPKVAVVTTTDQEIPISAVIIHTGFPLDSPKDLSVGLIRRGAMYIMCGSNSDCTLPGTPTVKRGRLVRREALELALYSFRYLGDVHQVVVFMPPAKGKTPSQALFFREGDVARELDRPLTASLSPRVPSVSDVTVSPDARLVDQITAAKTFDFSLTGDQTSQRGFIVLDPPTDPAATGSSGSGSSASGSSGSSSSSSSTSTGSSSTATTTGSSSGG
jgi:hypothetical protein